MQVMNFFLQSAIGSLKRQTLSWHILITASERKGCSGAARCCVELIANNEKYLKGQILLLLSWCFGKGAAETRKLLTPATFPSALLSVFKLCKVCGRASGQHLLGN